LLNARRGSFNTEIWLTQRSVIKEVLSVYRISELAEKVGLSRASLLYYEKQGLLHGARQANGYRRYYNKDVQQLLLLQQLQSRGLTLKECKALLDSKVNRAVLEKRLHQLDEEIEHKITIYERYLGEFGYHMFVLQNTPS